MSTLLKAGIIIELTDTCVREVGSCLLLTIIGSGEIQR